MTLIFDLVLGFPSAPNPCFWRDGSVVAALCARLRVGGLWFDYHHVGLDGGVLKRVTGDAQLGRWSARWDDGNSYQLATSPTPGDTTVMVIPSPRTLRLYFWLGASVVEARRRELLELLVAWVVAVRVSELAGGVRIRRCTATLDEDLLAAPPRWRSARAWDTGSVLDVIDRDVYAEVVASNYVNGRYGTVAEGEAELAAILAAPMPAGTTRQELGRLVVWKHVPDLTDAAATERARLAQQAWITALVPTEGGD